jgi:hypothetical protein
MMALQPLAPLDLSLEPLQLQLFRYAQDLQDVLSKQSNLLKQHQNVLHFIGRGDPDDERLLNSLLRQVKLYFVTNAQGEILHASHAMERALGLGGASLNWRSIETLIPLDQQPSVRQLLEGMAHHDANLAIQQRRILSLGSGLNCDPVGYDALIMKGWSGVLPEIYWLMNPVTHSADTDVDALNAFPMFVGGAQGRSMNDPFGSICAFDAAFSATAGYCRTEAVGSDPRMLSSGLQALESYQLSAKQADDVGTWCGEIFNRRKNGQVGFEWATIKEVQNVMGDTVSYLALFADLPRPAIG